MSNFLINLLYDLQHLSCHCFFVDGTAMMTLVSGYLLEYHYCQSYDISEGHPTLGHPFQRNAA